MVYRINQGFNSYPWPGSDRRTIIFSTGPTPPDKQPKKVTEYSEVSPKNTPMLIILADDDADDRELFAEVVEDTGIKVKLECAVDGKNLVEMLQRPGADQPDLIFLDLNMPNKNGRECLEFIRKSERLKHIPVVIYSTSSSLNDIEDTFEKGANLYVSKPSSYSELLAMARNVLLINWENYKPGGSRANYVFSMRNR